MCAFALRDAADVAAGASPADWLARAMRFEQDGEFFKAYDVAMQALQEHPGDAALAHRAVLCLANAGALALARRRFRELGLDAREDSEAITLDGRLHKSEAYATRGADRQAHLLAAAFRYDVAYRRAREAGASDAYYPGINVATLHLLAGEEARASAVALDIRDQLGPGLTDGTARGYWELATMIEACVILGDFERARQWIPLALAAGTQRPADLATTARQIRRILEARGDGSAWLGELAPPDVIHYSGHMIGERSRIPASAEADVARRIAETLDALRVGAAYGSLAAGTDILFGEALLARGSSLNVTLPFAVDDFIAKSVAPSGSAWVARFERCLSAATTVRFATEDGHLGDDQLYAYASRLAMGLAALCARHLCTTRRQLAVWDGQAPGSAAGTAADIVAWRRAGLPQTIIAYGDGPVVDLDRVEVPAAPESGRDTRAMLFGDMKGFSKLGDAQIPVFTTLVLGVLGQVTDRFRDEISLANTWGDGIFLVFEDPGAAARCALAMQAAMASLDLAAAGLPPTLALRVGGHLGPVYRIDDPVLHRANFMGAHVSRAARIEPITPEGCVYVTETFAAVLALEHAQEFACDYVGITEMAKGYEPMRMFLLRPGGGADGPSTLRDVQ